MLVALLIVGTAVNFAMEWKPLRAGLVGATRLEPSTVPHPAEVRRVGIIIGVNLGITAGEELLPLRAVIRRERKERRRFYRVDTDDGDLVGYAWEPATSPSRRT